MPFEMFDVTRLLGLHIFGSDFRIRPFWKLYFSLFHLTTLTIFVVFILTAESDKSDVAEWAKLSQKFDERVIKWKINFETGASFLLFTCTGVRYLFVHMYVVSCRKHVLACDNVVKRTFKFSFYRPVVVILSLWALYLVCTYNSKWYISYVHKTSTYAYRLLNSVMLLGNAAILMEVNVIVRSLRARLKYLTTGKLSSVCRLKSFGSLKGAVDDVNAYCGVAILCGVSTTFVSTVASVQSSILISMSKNVQCGYTMTGLIVKTLILVYSLYDLASASKSLRYESEHFHRHLYSTLMKESSTKTYPHDMLVRIHLAYRTPLQIYVWNICPLDLTLMTQMLSGTCTYLILLLQAQLPPNSHYGVR